MFSGSLCRLMSFHVVCDRWRVTVSCSDPLGASSCLAVPRLRVSAVSSVEPAAGSGWSVCMLHVACESVLG